MAKEVMKLGDIVCSIDAETSYRVLRNQEEDFTIAREKPRLKAEVLISEQENGWVNYKLPDAPGSIRANPLGAEIISQCRGKKMIETIAYDLADKYDVDDDDEFLEQVKTFLNIFKTYKLI
ncbi:MAG: PqqD family peptide modification chaperone [Calditrichaeota bacterium]|nr:PqqD family peptide modification chaperone [Calditrichota bacterium]